jgi:hypothetical protein
MQLKLRLKNEDFHKKHYLMLIKREYDIFFKWKCARKKNSMHQTAISPKSQDRKYWKDNGSLSSQSSTVEILNKKRDCSVE